MLAQPAPFAFGPFVLNVLAVWTLDVPTLGVPVAAADHQAIAAVQLEAAVVAEDRVVDLDTHTSKLSCNS